MIDALIAFSIRKKAVIGLLTLGLVIWGLYSFTQLPIDAVPDITNNQVQIITVSPTLAAQEIEQFITYPVETAMATIPDVTEIRSISRFGLSVITIVFEEQVDTYLARQQVSEGISTVIEQIPEEFGKPEMMPVSTGLGEIYQYVLHTKDTTYSLMELRSIQDWIVRRQLLGTVGVADVSSFGGYVKQYEVALRPETIRSMNVTIADVYAALKNNNENTGGSYIEKGPNTYFIRGIGLAKTIDDIERIVIKNYDGVPVRIRDVATVGFGHAARYGAMTRNEEEAVGGIVLMLKGENSSQVIERVQERVAVIQKSLPPGVVIEPFLERSKLVNKAIRTVSTNLIEGGLIVIFVLVLLMGSLRAGLVVASVIPLAMLFAISMMNVFGISGNLMSLGAIDFGLIVDGAVIIVESIVHRIGLSPSNRILTQQEMDDTVLDASVKIRQSAAFGEIIILIVYLPILALVGIEGKMFKPMAQVVSFAIIGALILSLTYVPMMSALFLSKKISHKKTIADRIISGAHRLYDPVIRFALRLKYLVVAVAIALFVVSILIFTQMGGEFIPTLEEGDFAVETRVPAGSSLGQSVKNSTEAAKILLKKFPEVTEVVGRIGSSEIPTDPMPIEANDMMVLLKDKSEWTSADTREELAEKMSEALEVLPGAEFSFLQPIQMRFNELMSGAKTDIAIKIFGEDLNVLARKGKEVAALITNIEGVEDVAAENITGQPQIIVEYDRNKIAQYGMNIEDLNTTLSTAFAGASAGVIFEGERRFDLVVRLDSAYRTDIDRMQDLPVTIPAGGQIPLSEVASIGFRPAPVQISREDAKRRISIGTNVRGRDVESVIEEISAKLDKELDLPPGYYIDYGGQFENLRAAKDRLMIAVPVALLLIFVLLYFTFGSVIQSMLIFTAIPLSAIGGIFALAIFGMPFSISAGVGFIALFGVAVLNGIVLIGYFNQLEKEGMTDVDERIIQGTNVRLRPVLMTAAVASLGFLPMALSTSAGAEVQRPLATVVIGGLISSTLLTLIVLPVLYSIAGRKRLKPPTQTPPIATAIVLFLCSAQLFSQETLTLDQALSRGIQQNRGIQSAELRIREQSALRSGSWDIGRTSIEYERGQYNSAVNDNILTLRQGFALPMYYSAQAELGDKRIATATQERDNVVRLLKRNIESAYYELEYAVARRNILAGQDSIFRRFAEAAARRFEAGETNLLEKVSSATRESEIRAYLSQADVDVQIASSRLQTLLGAKGPIAPSNVFSKHSSLVKSDTLGSAIANPNILLLKRQSEEAEARIAVEKALLLPDFSVGAMTQSIDGEGGFYGFAVGVSAPLWFAPQKSRIQAAEIAAEATRTSLDYEQSLTGSDIQILYDRLEKFRTLADFYEKNALREIQVIIETAERSYRAGEINYMEYAQNLQQAFDMRLRYSEALNDYNQTAIDIEYMSGASH